MSFSMSSLSLALPTSSSARRGRVTCKAVAAPALRMGMNASGSLSLGSSGEPSAQSQAHSARSGWRREACETSGTAPAAFGRCALRLSVLEPCF